MNQTCKVCGHRDKFNFNVPNDVWEAVVPLEYQNRVVCLACFDDFATARRVDYAARLDTSLWFAAERGYLRIPRQNRDLVRLRAVSVPLFALALVAQLARRTAGGVVVVIRLRPVRAVCAEVVGVATVLLPVVWTCHVLTSSRDGIRGAYLMPLGKISLLERSCKRRS